MSAPSSKVVAKPKRILRCVRGRPRGGLHFPVAGFAQPVVGSGGQRLARMFPDLELHLWRHAGFLAVTAWRNGHERKHPSLSSGVLEKRSHEV